MLSRISMNNCVSSFNLLDWLLGYMNVPNMLENFEVQGAASLDSALCI